MDDRSAAPINPLPPLVWLMALPLIGIEVALQLGSAGLVGGREAIGWRVDLVQRLAFVPDYFRQTIGQGIWSRDSLLRLVSYPLVHGSITHALFAVVMLLALGKYVGEVFRGWALLAVVVASTVAGAVAQGLAPRTEAALFGAYPPVFGLIGAFTYILWARLGRSGGNRLAAFRMIGFLLVAQLAFGALFGAIPGWISELAGFAAGFLLSAVVSPGGIARLRDRLRQR